MNKVERASELISRVSTVGGSIAGVLIVVMTSLILAEIFSRTFLARSLYIVEETSGWLLVAVTFLGLAWTLKEGGHVQITLVTGRFSQRVQYQITTAVAAVGVGFFIFFDVFAWDRLMFIYRANICGMTIYHFPMYPVWIALFVGGCLFTLQFIGVILENIVSIRRLSKAGTGV